MLEKRQEPSGTHQFVIVPQIPQRAANLNVMYSRLVVMLVVMLVLMVGTVAAAVGLFYVGTQLTDKMEGVQFGPFNLLVSMELPPVNLILIAFLGIIIIAVTAISFEVFAALMSINPRRRLLSSYRLASNCPVELGNVRVTALIPAHNEEFSLPVTLAGLRAQTRPPDRVIVVADNCTDRTVQIAREMGFEAIESVDNVHRKAGALNQVLTRILPYTDARDVILVMDADTVIDPRFIEVAAAQLDDDAELSAVGGVFYGENGNGLIGQFQRNEYTRYSRQIRSRHGRVFVLTGTATVFRADVLLDVAAARGGFIPGETGCVYDTSALTEDNELTIALKSLGATMTSPVECMVTTEIMPTWRNLWVQRQRWQRGALENLSAYGLTRATLRYWGQQVGIGYGTFALNLALLLMLITIVSVDQWVWFPFWLTLGMVFVAERVITAWRGGWKARILAALLFPELAYDVFLQVVFLKCLLDITLARRTAWGHVKHPLTPVGA